jgi:hypothetical protein
VMGGRSGMIHRLPFGSGWTDGRDMPAPAGRTFSELYKARARRMTSAPHAGPGASGPDAGSRSAEAQRNHA